MRPAPIEEPEAVEFEPRPRLFEEDENEEVGRPDGPRERGQVDPYAWGGVDFRSAPPHQDAPSHEPARDVEARDEPGGGPESFDVEDPESEQAPSPLPAPESHPSTPPPAFGRRGRSRR